MMGSRIQRVGVKGLNVGVFVGVLVGVDVITGAGSE